MCVQIFKIDILLILRRQFFSVELSLLYTFPGFFIECAQIRGPQYVQEMWAYICPELLKAIEAEPESALVSEHLSSMAR